jgi:catechol 2,3-dioxygenase-like lactoylglutathione lyase family enzyme
MHRPHGRKGKARPLTQTQHGSINMPKIESYQKQAKLLVRWHRERNYSVGGKVRQLERYKHLTDAQILAVPLPLMLAQEVVAVEAGFANWAALRVATDGVAQSAPEAVSLQLKSVTPILFVRDVRRTATFYADKLGFAVDFLHGHPAFYGAVSRDGVCLHLRFVHQANFEQLAALEGGLILATIEVTDVKALFAEYDARGVDFAQRLVRQAWGGLDFHVRDPDGNCISFVEYRISRGEQPG